MVCLAEVVVAGGVGVPIYMGAGYKIAFASSRARPDARVLSLGYPFYVLMTTISSMPALDGPGFDTGFHVLHGSDESGLWVAFLCSVVCMADTSGGDS